MWIGAASGAAQAAANGGNILRGAITGAISAAVFYGIGQQFRNMAAQNAGKVAESSLHNFGGNMLTYRQIAGQILEHAVAGGALSYLQGGKFANGANTAAYQFLFNAVSSALTNRRSRVGRAATEKEAIDKAIKAGESIRNKYDSDKFIKGYRIGGVVLARVGMHPTRDYYLYSNELEMDGAGAGFSVALGVPNFNGTFGSNDFSDALAFVVNLDKGQTFDLRAASDFALINPTDYTRGYYLQTPIYVTSSDTGVTNVYHVNNLGQATCTVYGSLSPCH